MLAAGAIIEKIISGQNIKALSSERRRCQVGYGKGCPFPSRLEGLGERLVLTQRSSVRKPGRKHILAYFKGHRTLLFAPQLIKYTSIIAAVGQT